MQVSIRIQGLNKVIRGLTKLGVSLDDLRPMFTDIAREASGHVRSETPRRSGRLAASVRPSASARRAVVRAGGAAAKYAGPINYGWPSRGIAPAGFMQKGSDAIEPKVIPALEDGISTIIREAGL